jgi:hypothetical protein
MSWFYLYCRKNKKVEGEERGGHSNKAEKNDSISESAGSC